MSGLNLTELLNLPTPPTQTGAEWSFTTRSIMWRLYELAISYMLLIGVKFIVYDLMMLLHLSNVHQANKYAEKLPEEIKAVMPTLLSLRFYTRPAKVAGFAAGLCYLSSMYEVPYFYYYTPLLLISAFMPVYGRTLGLRILIKAALTKDQLPPPLYATLVRDYSIPFRRNEA